MVGVPSSYGPQATEEPSVIVATVTATSAVLTPWPSEAYRTTASAPSSAKCALQPWLWYSQEALICLPCVQALLSVPASMWWVAWWWLALLWFGSGGLRMDLGVLLGGLEVQGMGVFDGGFGGVVEVYGDVVW